MEKKTQAQIIMEYLKLKGDWVMSYEIIKVNTPFGWLGSGADRQARQLAIDGKILREKIGKYARYKAIIPNEQMTLPV